MEETKWTTIHMTPHCSRYDCPAASGTSTACPTPWCTPSRQVAPTVFGGAGSGDQWLMRCGDEAARYSAVLSHLQELGYSHSLRLITSDGRSLSTCDGCPYVVTSFAPSVEVGLSPPGLQRLGSALAALHALPVAAAEHLPTAGMLPRNECRRPAMTPRNTGAACPEAPSRPHRLPH